MSERSFPIAGMTCAACEVTVAEAALGLPGVTRASASARTGLLRLEGAATDAQLALALQSTPYGLGARPWWSQDRAVWRDFAIALVAVVFLGALAVGLGLDRAVGALQSQAVAGSLLFVVMLGVAASISTCMALVGGLVLSLGASTQVASIRPHIAFNLGRLAGFTVLGAGVGMLGQAFSLTGWGLGVAMLAAALVMAALGVRLTGLSPRASAWQLSLPSRWGAWARRSGSATPTQPSRDLRAVALGAASFFLPCGFTQAVQIMALTSGSAARGALIMGAFALGTTPGLLATGAAASAAQRPSAVHVLRAMGVVVLAFAVATGAGAINTIAPRIGVEHVVATARTANVVDVDGVQHATVTITSAGYEPAQTVVYADEPVRWILDADIVSCAGLVDASALGVGNIDALSGEVSADFILDSTGTFPFACRMGMYSGSVTAIDRPGDPSSGASRG